MRIYDDYTPLWAKIVPIIKGKYPMWRVLMQESYRAGFVYTSTHYPVDKWTLTEAIEAANHIVTADSRWMNHRVNFGIAIDLQSITPDHDL